jgi:curli biogenesis system outer membrane secretion channel CsgG
MHYRHHCCTRTGLLAGALAMLILGLISAPSLAQSSVPAQDRTTRPPVADTAQLGEETGAVNEKAAGQRVRVGVLEIKGSGLQGYYQTPSVELGHTVRLAPPPNFTEGLTEILTTALIQQGRFQVLERAKLNEVLAEQDLATSGRVSSATGAATGKVTGAQILITGDVTEFSYQQSAVGGGLGLFKKARVGGGVGKITAKMALDLRLIDATTGEVLASSRGEGKASTTGLAADFAQSDKELGVGGAKQTPLGKAARQAVERAIEDLARNTESLP